MLPILSGECISLSLISSLFNLSFVENRQVLEPARLEKLLGSDSSTPQEPVANPPLDASVVRDSDDNNRTANPNDTNEGKKSTVDGENRYYPKWVTFSCFWRKVFNPLFKKNTSGLSVCLVPFIAR